MRNQDIHKAFIETGVFKWMVAEKLGISDVTFSKKLRKELSQEEKKEVLELIKELNQKPQEV